MAFHFLNLLLTVSVFTVAAGEVQFTPSTYSVSESEGYVVVKVCPTMNESAMNDTDSSGMPVPLTVYITSEGQSASKLQLCSIFL